MRVFLLGPGNAIQLLEIEEYKPEIFLPLPEVISVTMKESGLKKPSSIKLVYRNKEAGIYELVGFEY